MNFEALPSDLMKEGRFCCWRYEEREGRKTKVPYHPGTGQMAKSNDPKSFVSFEMAAQAQGYDGIGVGIFGTVCAIDLDHCITDSGYYTPVAAEIIDMMHTYTEISPSGDGVHLFFRTNGFRYDTKRCYIMNHDADIEVYVAGTTNKYVTVTGKRTNDFPFDFRDEELKQVLEKFMLRPVAEQNSDNRAENAINAVNSEVDDRQLLKRMLAGKNGAALQQLWNGSINGYQSPSEADMALCSHLAYWTGKNAAQMDRMFRQSGLMREKWDRKQSGTTYGAITIQKAIDGCKSVYTIPQQTNEAFEPLIPLKPQGDQLPEFPTDCLPPVLRDYVKAVAAHSQTSEDMAAVIGLGVLAVCLQGKYLVQGTPGYFEPLSLYTVVIASPGERKSSVMRDMTKYLYEYEQEFNANREPEIKANRHERESLQRQISGIQEKLKHTAEQELELELRQLENQLEELPVVKPVRFFADDCSSEALTSLLANNGGVFSVISTEGGIFDIMAGRYSNKVNIDVWLKGHCGDAIRVDRLGREPEYIPHPALSAILSIQPSVLAEIMSNATMTGRGLIARFLYASPPSRIGSRVFCTPPVPSAISEAYRNMIYQLMALPRPEAPCVLTFSDRALDVIADYFQKHEQFLVGEGQVISDWASKYIGSVLRIAGLLHAAENDELVIPVTTVSRAIQIGKYFLAHSAYAYSMMGMDVSIQKALFVLAKLKKQPGKEIKRSELFQMCRGKFFKKTAEIMPTLELLERHHYIRMEQPRQSTVGRPPDIRVLLNPEA